MLERGGMCVSCSHNRSSRGLRGCQGFRGVRGSLGRQGFQKDRCEAVLFLYGIWTDDEGRTTNDERLPSCHPDPTGTLTKRTQSAYFDSLRINTVEGLAFRQTGPSQYV